MIAWPRWVRVTDQAGPGGAGVAVDETPIKIAIAEVAGQLACSAGFWRNRVETDPGTAESSPARCSGRSTTTRGRPPSVGQAEM